MSHELPKFCEFADEQHGLDGAKTRLDDVINREIVITGHRLTDSKYNAGRCLTIQFYFLSEPSEKHVVFTGSSVLSEQMRKYGDRVPFCAVIKKIDKYYTLA